MVLVEGGCFNMGSDKGALLEGPVHKVCLSSFKIEKHEVTQKFFQSVMKTNPSRFVSADLPVESVTWQEANQYCKKIGREIAHGSGMGVRCTWRNNIRVLLGRKI